LDVPSSSRLGRVFLGTYKRWILSRTLRAANKVITFSGAQARFLQDTYGVTPEAIAIIPNGVGPEFSPRPRDTDIRRPLRVLYVGRLSQQKAVPRLIKALAAMTQPVEAVLVGEGDQRPFIEDLIREIGRANISMAGARNGSELIESYHWADVFVLPSDREGMPLAALEAMACGLPVVATDVIGNRELLSNVGLLVQPEPTALARALDQLAEDAPLRAALRDRSLAAAEGYTLDRTIELLRKLYAEVESE
jgi:glycosyltransferase involved in cell wall biosynthesis